MSKIADLIVRDVAELDYSGAGFNEERMMSVTDDDLRTIVERHVTATSTKPAGGVAGAGEVRTWQERMYTPNADGLLPESEIDAADAEIADLRAQLARQQAPVGDSVVCKSLGALLLTQAEREKHDIGSPVGDSVDTPEFDTFLKHYVTAETYTDFSEEERNRARTALITHITAWKDAQLARAEQRGRTAAIEDYRSIVDDLRAQLARERQGQGEDAK